MMADERAPSRSGSPDANEKLLADCREVIYFPCSLEAHLSLKKKHTFQAKKGCCAESDTLEGFALGYSYLRRNVVPGPAPHVLRPPRTGA